MMRILALTALFFLLTGCGIKDSNWFGESGHDGWHGESGQEGWHAESGDDWYGKNLKEEGNECNVYGRCGKGGGGGDE